MGALTADNVKQAARRFGGELVGIASADRFAVALPGCRPDDLLRSARSVVVYVKRIPFGSATPHPSISYLQAGYYGLESHVNRLSYKIALWLEDHGAVSVPSPAGRDILSLKVLTQEPEPKIVMQGSFDLRLAAVQAGLGQIGVNNNLLTEEFGSRVRIGAVITRAALEPDQPKAYGVVPEFCVMCGYRCVKACPAKALPGTGAVDHYRCMVLRPDRVAPEKALAAFDRRYSGPPLRLAGNSLAFTDNAPHPCATCITLCPMDYGRKLKKEGFHREGWSEADFNDALGPGVSVRAT